MGDPAPRRDREVTQAAQVDAEAAEEFGNAAVEAAPVSMTGVGRKTREIGLVVVVCDKPLGGDQTGDDADGEGAAAEAETIDLIAGLIVAATEAVDREHVALQSKSEDAAERRKQLERRRADAVIVESDLAFRIAQIEDLE